MHAKDHKRTRAAEPAPNRRIVGAIATPTEQTATRAPDTIELEPGTMVGEYRVERKIGQGGMGVVYAAVHPLIGKTVAIKILPKARCADSVLVRRFIDEARVVNQIDHPNIVDIFAFGDLAGSLYFVMEWLKGETLYARLERGPLTVRETCTIVKSLALALEAAHAKGVIHRDVKPDNVFLVDSGDELPVVKLLDFGIAKLLDRDTEHTFGGRPLGTPAYVAPELAAGRPATPSADIYSLGATLFQMLVGRPPFAAATPVELLRMHLDAPPPSPSAFVAVAPELDHLVLGMLAKNPGARPRLAGVRAVADGLLDRGAPAPKPTPARRFRRRWLVLAASLIAAGALAAVTASWRVDTFDAGVAEPRTEVVPRADASLATEVAAPVRGETTDAAVEHDASPPASAHAPAVVSKPRPARRPRPDAEPPHDPTPRDPPAPARGADDMLMAPDPNRPHTRPQR